MTASPSYRIGDIVGVWISGGSGDFLDLVTERIVALSALDPHRVVTLLRVADAAAFFTREELCSGAIKLDFRIWHVRPWHGGRARLLVVLELLPNLAIAVLIGLTYECLFARRAMASEKVLDALHDAVAASRAPPESAAFNHEIEPDDERGSEPAGDRLVRGVSGLV